MNKDYLTSQKQRTQTRSLSEPLLEHERKQTPELESANDKAAPQLVGRFALITKSEITKD